MNKDADVRVNDSASADPRVQRTKKHVLSIVRELLEESQGALTLSLVADRAMVARQTLYTHWGTIENLIADTIVVNRRRSSEDFEGLDARARAELFFTELKETLDPVTASAASAMIGALHYDRNAGLAFNNIDRALFEDFLVSVGPATHDQFLELVSPIILMILRRDTVSRETIASLADRATQFID